ncbi:MAG: PspC domain-containing protein [Acidobacteriia bacterium]|nr:PspC domain-containing protein [Terriglobia bacterium]
MDAAARFCSQCGKGTGQQESQARSTGYYAPRRVYRLMYDKKVGGVCAGLAKYLDVDVTLVRILTLCVALFTGVGFLGYLLAWIVMPKDYGIMRPAQSHAAQEGPAGAVVG